MAANVLKWLEIAYKLGEIYWKWLKMDKKKSLEMAGNCPEIGLK